jgi:ABC-type glycerol-3-phosphate transport system permease component
MPQRSISLSQLRFHWRLYLFALPAAAFVLLFQYYPALSGIFHSFYRWNGADVVEPVGLGNYTRLLTSIEFWTSFRFSLVLGFFNVLKMAPAVLVAVCIHRCRNQRVQYFYRLLFVIPMVIPSLVIVFLWRTFFFEAGSGFLNRFLAATHGMQLLAWLGRNHAWGQLFAPGRMPAWTGDPLLLPVACIIWGFPWVGSFAVLVHLAKLQNIGRDVYEAADLDGVNWWSKFWQIELPTLLGSLNLLLVFVIIDTIKDAGTILALAGDFGGGPGGVATVPALLMLRKAFVDQELGYACGIGVVITVIVLTIQKLGTLAAQFAPRLSLPRREPRPSRIAQWRYRRSQARALARSQRPPLEYEVRALAASFPLRAFRHALILAVAAFALLPLYLMCVVSFKSNQQYYLQPLAITHPLHPENWSTAAALVVPAVANSLFISIGATFLTLALALAAAYFFARQRMPLSSFMWNGLLILMIMPTIANLTPLFCLMRDLHLLNSLTGLVLVGASGGQAFAVFVLASFVADIPTELFEAAEVDGASHLRQMLILVLPLAAPILGTIGVMQFIGQWNDFVLPLIVMRDNLRLPVMVQLMRMAGEYIKYWGPLMAGYSIASVPVVILFVFTMRLFTRGLTEGAVKG